MPSNHLILCHPLLLLPSIFPSIRVFSNESVHCIRWPNYWSFSFSISPFNEYSVLISFMIDWFDLLVVQGNLQGSSPVSQFESINSLAVSLFTIQISRLYMTTGKTIALIIQTFVKVVSLLFNMLSRFVIDFLPRSKCLLILWLQSPSTMILEPNKISKELSLFRSIYWFPERLHLKRFNLSVHLMLKSSLEDIYQKHL